MHYRDVLKNCAAILGDRDKKYGDSDACFTRIAKIASIVLDHPISTYDVAIILSCVKLGRIPGDPAYADNYVDLANYAAFGAHFAEQEHLSPSPLSSVSGLRQKSSPPVDPASILSIISSIEEDVVERPEKK